jgi:hypothetical protein
MATDNALSFVGQIQTEHKAVLKADGEALKHAIECGKYLNLAKENVEAAKPKVKWSSWREQHISEISQETASVYTRLASAYAEDENIFADCESIRDAIKKLPKRERKRREKPEDGKPDTGTSSALLNPTGASPDLKAMLQNVAVDEVCSVLTQTWDADQLRDLIKRVNLYLATRPPPTDIPTMLRRPLTPAQPSQG